MERPKIRIESDGMRTFVYIDGKEVKGGTSIKFQASAKDGLRVQWNGTFQKKDENGNLIIENNEIKEEEFHYDSGVVMKI